MECFICNTFFPMKKLIICPILILSISLFSVLANPNSSLSNNAYYKVTAQKVLPDSLFILIKDKPIIYYYRGHNSHTWSLLVKTDSSYRIYSGISNYYGVQYYDRISDSTSFDTLKLLSLNEALLSWGLDTMPAEAINMEKVHWPQYFPIYTSLSVFNAEGVEEFDSDDAIAFSGGDSITFNTKFHKLSLIMWWLSAPKIRPYIPEELIF